MKRTPDNLNLAARLGVDEAELLAWIEGEVDDATDDRMQRLLKAAPHDDAKGIVAMRRDAILLNTMTADQAPEGLVESAIAQAQVDLERGMLLEDGQPIPFGQARTKVVHAPSRLLDLVFDSMVGRLAIAAVLVLSGGSAVYLAMGVWNTTPAPTPNDTSLAINDEDEPLNEIANEGPELTLAGTDTPEPPIEQARPASVEEGVVAEPMPMELATTLCAERRLLIRVTTESSLDTLARLDGFVRESHRGRPWSLARSHDASLIAAVESRLPRMRDVTTSLPETILADEDDPIAPIDLPRSPMPPIPEIAPSIYVASVRMDSSSLEALVTAMQRGAVTGIELLELDEPLPVPDAAPTRDSILWWGRPVEEWLPRTDVAVVIEVE